MTGRDSVEQHDSNTNGVTVTTDSHPSLDTSTLHEENNIQDTPTAIINGHGVTHSNKQVGKRPARDEDDVRESNKRRKTEGSSGLGPLTRTVSPPWQFGSVEMSRLDVGGKRRSTRTTATSSPAIDSENEKKRLRRESAPKAQGGSFTTYNGDGRHGKGLKAGRPRKHDRSFDKPVPSPTFKKPTKPARPAEAPSKVIPKRTKSSSTLTPASKRLTNAVSETQTAPRRGGRRSLRQQSDEQDVMNMPDPKESPGRFQRLRLRVREPTVGRSHPTHWAPVKKYASFGEWLKNDDPLEGEPDVPLTDTDVQKEAGSRLRIVRATVEGGPLSKGKCVRFLEDDSHDPLPRYNVWSHLCAHAVNFCTLLGREKEKHRRWAKQLALACQMALATDERWAKVREQKTDAEIQQEEAGYQQKRYRQLIKDVGASWELARNEVNKIRFEQWEKEQEMLGKKALDEMLDHSTQLLYQHQTRDSSELASEVRSSLGPTGSETASVIDNSDEDERIGSDSEDESPADSENMSEESDEDEHMETIADDDARLSPEALRRKYAEALTAIRESDISGSEEEYADAGSGTEEDDAAISEDEEENDEDEEDETQGNNLLSLLLPKEERDAESSSSFNKAEEVDSKMDSAGTEHDRTSASGSPRPIPELEEVDDMLLDHSSEESTDMDDSESEDSESASEDSRAVDDESEHEDIGLMGFYAKQIQRPEKMQLTQGEDDDVENIDSAIDIEEDAKMESQLTSSARSQPSTPRTPNELFKTEVPSQLLRGSLREYQHDGLDWLSKLYNGSRNGILADEMGLGKTIQTISLLAHLAVNHRVWGPHLVVVPTSVMLNWEMEFKKWLPGFKILTYYGDIEERKKKRQGWLNDDKWNVCIASYQLILKDAQAFKKRSWHYLILDEAHYIKNFQSQKWQTLLTFRTHSRLLLTGTPLQNDLQELWSLLYFLMPAGLDGSGGFADLEKFLNSMKRPADQILNQGQQKLDAEAQARVTKLHEVLRPFLLRRLKSEVEKQMPGKYEHVVYCRLSKRQRQLYDEFMSRSDTKRTLSSGNYMSIMNCLMSLRKVCNHPDLFETRQIVTSLAMPRSVVADFEIKELVVRRRLLKEKNDTINFEYSGLIPTAFEKHSRLHQFRRYHLRAIEPLHRLAEKQSKRLKPSPGNSFATMEGSLDHLKNDAEYSILDSLKNCVDHARRTTDQWPIYGTDFCKLMTIPNRYFPAPPTIKQMKSSTTELTTGKWATEHFVKRIQVLMPTIEEVALKCDPIVRKFACLTPVVVAEDVVQHALTPAGVRIVREAQALTPRRDPYHEARMRASIAFPDKRLLQYDCGKLQALDKLLRDLQSGGHRCLIFTQMTKVLDILEQFLNIHGHRYLRLDGATKIEQRQILTDRFNNDTRILAFILSSRSGGLGINLTGADTVIFYDLDWNPAMDAQCQDRCHRIGQTRDVHIYRFVSEHTIEANILRKSNQKRLLDDVIIQKGEFTTDYFNRVTYKDAFTEPEELVGDAAEASAAMDRVLGEVTGLGQVLDSVEDMEDAAAAKVAQKEAIYNADENDFNDSNMATDAAPTPHAPDGVGGIIDEVADAARVMAAEDVGAIDDWMVRYLNEYEMKGLPVILPKAVLNAKKSAARKGRDYKRKR